MTFNLTQLDSLTFDEAEPLLENYIDQAIETFAHSQEGRAFLENHALHSVVGLAVSSNWLISTRAILYR